MRLHLPNLHAKWPLQKVINPFGSLVNSGSISWIKSFELFNTEQVEKFINIKTGILTSIAYPNHSEEHLRVACDLLNMLFATDEVSDCLDGEEAEKLIQEIIHAIKCLSEEKSIEKDNHAVYSVHPLVMLHISFFKHVITVTNASVYRRLSNNYVLYLEAVVKEAIDREHRAVSKSVEEYMELRLRTGGVPPSFDMILLPLSIPDHILNEQRIQNLEKIANELIVSSNDIISFNKEYALGHTHNMVVMMMHTKGIGIQEAIYAVARWYNRRTEDFLVAMNDLPESDDPKVNEDVRKYVNGLGAWVTGNYEWSFETERYWAGALHEEAKVSHEVVVETTPEKAIASPI